MRADWSEKEWRQFYETRRKNSEVWQFIHLLGSLKLAMVLLFTIPVACAVATIYESKFNSQIAQTYIYKHPWFIFWLGVLCINLFAVTLTRWPWRRKHIGFVITHFGIIILLIGAAVGQKKGFEASVTLHTTQNPTRQLVINRTILQVQGDDDMSYKINFPVEANKPTPERPRELRVPKSPLKLIVDGYSEALIESNELVDSPLPNTGMGISLLFSSGMMAQSMPVNLTEKPAENSTNEFFGRAQIHLVDALPDRSAAKPPENVIRESQMVFEKFEPVVTNRETPENPKPSGYRLALVLDRNEKAPVMHLVIQTPKGHREIYELAKVMGKPLTLHGDATRIVVKDYWPDFELKDGQASSKSEEPNNPAVLVTLDNDGTEEKPLLELASVGGGSIAYQMSRGGFVHTKGVVSQGDTFALGWADWSAKLTKVLPNALMRTVLTPTEGGRTEETVPGVHARLSDPSTKQQGPPQWIPSGRGVVLRLDEKTTFVGFGLEVFNLPFTLHLQSFEVPRDEGTATPSDFRSMVRFQDSITNETVDSLVHMNHPASFPEGFWRVAFGLNYKFSQANWNPQDLNETTLQVLHDPGWPAKWIGSLSICIGIAIMFYLKPAPSSGKKRRSPSAKGKEKIAA